MRMIYLSENLKLCIEFGNYANFMNLELMKEQKRQKQSDIN